MTDLLLTRRRSPGEAAAFERVEHDLTQRFPVLPAGTVAAAVREERRRLDDSPVRDFLPLLVQRAATARLRSRTWSA